MGRAENRIMSDRAADASLRNHIDGSSSHQQGRWRLEHGALSSAAQPINPEASIDQKRHSEHSINASQATCAWDHDVRIGNGKDVAVSTARSAAQRLRSALVIGTLFAAFGLGWI